MYTLYILNEDKGENYYEGVKQYPTAKEAYDQIWTWIENRKKKYGENYEPNPNEFQVMESPDWSEDDGE